MLRGQDKAGCLNTILSIKLQLEKNNSPKKNYGRDAPDRVLSKDSVDTTLNHFKRPAKTTCHPATRTTFEPSKVGRLT